MALSTPASGKPPTYRFETTLSSSGCGQTPLPPKGEAWVIYLKKPTDKAVMYGMPLEKALPYDKRLSKAR